MNRDCSPLYSNISWICHFDKHCTIHTVPGRKKRHEEGLDGADASIEGKAGEKLLVHVHNDALRDNENFGFSPKLFYGNWKAWQASSRHDDNDLGYNENFFYGHIVQAGLKGQCHEMVVEISPWSSSSGLNL
jgi:hypothetical protein